MDTAIRENHKVFVCVLYYEGRFFNLTLFQVRSSQAITDGLQHDQRQSIIYKSWVFLVCSGKKLVGAKVISDLCPVAQATISLR